MKNYEYNIVIKLYDSDEADWNAFAFGWQIGVKAVFKEFSLGISYGTDFTEMIKDADKLGSLQVTLGFTLRQKKIHHEELISSVANGDIGFSHDGIYLYAEMIEMRPLQTRLSLPIAGFSC